MSLHIVYYYTQCYAAAPLQTGAHLEGKHRQDEGVAGVIGESIAAVQPALTQHANQPRPRLQSRLQLVLPLALLAALHLNLGRQRELSQSVLQHCNTEVPQRRVAGLSSAGAVSEAGRW